MFGCLVASDAGEGAGNFAARCEVSLRAIAVNPNLWVVLGKAALNTASVVDGFGALRATIAAEEPAYGSSLSVVDTIFDRFLAIDDTKQAAHMLVTHMLGVELLDNPVLLATLCACCDNADNKTGACEQLGIQRQTLYNRLDKVTEMTGVSQTNRKAWSALLFCAKIGGAWLKALP
jgi:DNA-binding protein Fis